MSSLTVAVKSKRMPRSKESIREENELIILTAAEKVFAKPVSYTHLRAHET